MNTELFDKVIVQINDKYDNEIALAGSLYDFILREIRKQYKVFAEFYEIDESLSQAQFETEVLRTNILLIEHLKRTYKI